MRNLAVLALVTILCVFIGCLGLGGGGGGGGSGSSLPGPVIPASALLSGRVYFADRSFYGGIPVLAKNATGLILGSTRTDSQGYFYFTDVPDGIYDIFASTGESEIQFFSGAQVITGNPVRIPDKSLLDLSNVLLDQITSSSFRLRFESTVTTMAQVEYKASTEDPTTVSSGNTYTQNHQVDISGLVAGTRYGVTIKLRAQDGQTLVYPVIYTTTSTSAGPTNLSASINNGDIITRKLANRIYFNADGASQMRIGTSEDLTSQPWESYSSFKDLTFTAGEGTRRIYVQFKDLLGNLSGVINDSILLQTDNTGYIGVWINNGEALTNELDVILTILYPGAQQMQISDSADFLNSFWETYTSTRKVKISSGDGPKTIYVRFKGGTADESKSFSATIQLDTAGPQVEMLVNNGALKTNTSKALLSFTYSKQPVEMQIQETNSFVDDKGWLKFANPYKYVLPTGDGEKLIYVRFKDSLGNISSVIEGRITLDTKAPADPSMLINGGEETTKSLSVKLTLDVTGDDGESIYMLISNNENFTGAAQERFSKTKAWTLGGYGLQTVYAMFYDDASNSTTILVESIEVEGEPPSSSSVKINDGDPSTESNKVSVSITSDVTTKLRIAEHQNFSSVADIPFVANVGSNTMRIADYILTPLAGDKLIFVRMEDASGAFSISSDSILLVGPSSYSISTIDTQPLSSFSINLRPFAINAAQMLITESYGQIDDQALWRPFTYSTVFNLEKFLGKHTIYAKYRNSGNAETPVLTFDVLVSEVTPATPTIMVNLGDAVTTSSKVQIKVLSSGIYTKMQLSNDGTFYNSAELPVEEATWEINRSEGQKTIYARFFNPQSNEAEVVSDGIMARGPASATLYTKEVQPLNKNWVQLELYAEGATDMIVTEDPGVKTLNSGWIPYQTSLVYPLGDTTGQRTIYAKYRNAASDWIESVPVQTTVTVNATAPTGNTVAFRTTAAADSTRVTEVAPASMPIYLHFTILDSTTTSIAWKIVPGGAAVPADADMTIENVPVAPIPLTQPSFGGYGIFNLYYQFIDGVGNKSAIGVTSIKIINPDDIVTPTTGRITINYGDAVSESSNLSLNLYSSTASKVRVSPIESFSTIPDIDYVADPNGMNIPYSISPPTAGLKRIYARFESASGSYGFASDTITLVGPANPSMTVLDPLPLNKMWVELSLNAENASRMLISESLASFTNPAASGWEAFSYRKVLPLENRTGTHVIYCKFYNSTTSWVETDLLQATVSVNSTVPTGNNATFRATVATNSQQISEIGPASMPFYLHFNISDSKTATVSYKLIRADQPTPVLDDYALPILPVPFNPGDFPGYGTYHLYYCFVDGVGNRSPVAILPVKILEPDTEYSPVNGTVKINDGDSSTDRCVASLTLFSETATRIKISQSDTFSSVDYQNYVDNAPNGAMIVSYTLSPSTGNKTVYVRFEDASGSFVVANDSIELVGPLEPSLSTPDPQPLSTFSVHLRPLAENAAEMLITESYSDLITGIGWDSFSYTLDFTLKNTEGDHTIYAKYRNAGLVETPVVTLNVRVATIPEASPTVLINDGDVSVSSRTVTLRLFSESAASFTVSDSPSFAGSAVVPFTVLPTSPAHTVFHPYTLPAVAGNKTVYVRFADSSGDYTIVSDEISLLGPTSYTLTTDDSLPLSTNTVNLKPFANGASEMLITENYANIESGTGWSPFSFADTFDLAMFTGEHTVYAKYRNAGLVETPVMELKLTVASEQLESPSVVVNYGDLNTSDYLVTLRMFSADAASYSVSESPDFSTAPVAGYVKNPADGSMIVSNYPLSKVAGTKTVYVRFSNASGTYTTVNDSINLVGPTSYSLTTQDALPLSTHTVNLRPFANGAQEMLITESYASLSAGIGWNTFAYNYPFDLTLTEGNHTIYAKYRNAYDVETEVMTLNVTVDIPEPDAPTLLINNGDTSSSLATLTLKMYSVDAASFSVSESLNFSTATETTFPDNADRQHTHQYKVSPEAGLKNIYVRFQNASGTYTTVSDSITLIGPSNSALTTNDTQPLATYTLNLSPFAIGASQMLITEDYALLASETMWTTFNYSTNFELAQTEGKHTIYAKYRNAGHVETQLISLDVTVALGAAASPSIILNGGDAFTSSSRVEVMVATASDYSTVMYLSETGDFFGVTATQTAATTSYEFSDKLPGEKTLYARFKHNTRNEYLTVSDTITARGPENATISTKDAQPMNKTWVDLDLYAAGATGMKLATSVANLASTTTAWESYNTKKAPYVLTETGAQTIYCKFRNAETAWIETEPLTLNVTVNNTAPTGNTATFRKTIAPTSAAVTQILVASLPVYLHFAITDLNTATVSYALASAGVAVPTVFVNKSIPVAPIELVSTNFTGNGTFNLYYKFSDGVANETALNIISIDVLGPNLKISPQVAGPFNSGDTQTFTALKENVTGTVRWRITDPTPLNPLKHGSISSDGLYSAPANITEAATVTIAAYLLEDTSVTNSVTFELQTQVEVITSQTDYKISKGDTATITVTFANSTATGTVSVPSPASTYGSAVLTQHPSVTNVASLTYTAPGTVPSPAKVPLLISSLEDPTRTKTIYFEITDGTYVAINPSTANIRVIDGYADFVAETSSSIAATMHWVLPDGGSFMPSISLTSTDTPLLGGQSSIRVYASPSVDIASSPLRLGAYVIEGTDRPSATSTITLAPKVKVYITPENKELYLKSTIPTLFKALVENYISDSEVTWEYKNASQSWAVAETANGIVRPNGKLELSGSDVYYTPPTTFPTSLGTEVTEINIRAVSREDNSIYAEAKIDLRDLKLTIYKGYTNDPANKVTVASITLEVGQQKFFAEVSPLIPGTDPSVMWYVQEIAGGNSTYGTMDGTTGIYSAPDDRPQNSVVLKAVSNYNTSVFATVTINLLDFWAPFSDDLENNTGTVLPVNSLQIVQTTPVADDRILYAGTNSDGVFKASADPLDWSYTWLPTALSNILVYDVSISSQDSDRVVAATNNGVRLSTDGGTTFSALVIPYPRDAEVSAGFTEATYTYDFTKNISAVVIDPSDDTYMYAVGRDQGVVRFKWDGVNTYDYDGTLYDDDQIYSVPQYYSWDWTQNTGSVATPTLVTGSLIRPEQSDPLNKPSHRAASGTMVFTCIEMSAKDPNSIYVGFTDYLASRNPDVFRHGYIKLTGVRTAEYLHIGRTTLPVTGTPVPAGVLIPSGYPAGNPETVNNWYSVGASGIYYFDPAGGVVLSMAIDPNTPTTIWKGKDVGIFRTTDGTSFTQISGISPVNVRDIFIDPINTINVYIGTEAGLYRTRDAGANWKQIKSGLEGHTAINTLGLSPGNVGTRRIFCGTTEGVFMGGKSLDLE